MFKKITLVLFSILISSLVFSQINYGVKAGITESFIQSKVGGSSQDYGLRTGFQVGIFAESKISKKINFRPGIQLTQKGFKEVTGTPGNINYWNRNFSRSYLELPLEAVFNFHLNKNTSIQLGTGPVFGIGLFGKNRTVITFKDSAQKLYTQYWETKKVFGQRFDFGWDLSTGLKLNRATINVTYNHGFSNFYNSQTHKVRNRNFAFTVGYQIKK